jgi:hypothetical protein
MSEDSDLENVVEAWLSRERSTRAENTSRNVDNNNNGSINSNYNRHAVNNNSENSALSDTSSFMGSPTNSRLSSPTSRIGGNFYSNSVQSPSTISSPFHNSSNNMERQVRNNLTLSTSQGTNRKAEKLTEDILENQRKIRSLELKLTRCVSSVDSHEETCARLSRDFLAARQNHSNTALEYNNLSHQLSIFRKRAENLDILAQQSVTRREVDQMAKGMIHPLRSEIQMQLKNIGRQFSLHTKRIDEILKKIDDLHNANSSMSARVNALVKQQSLHNNRNTTTNKLNTERSSSRLLMTGVFDNSGVEKLSDNLWRQISDHIEAQNIKSQRYMENTIANQLRNMQKEELSGTINGNSLHIAGNSSAAILSLSNQSVNNMQLRVQECYANILRLGGQFAEEKERRTLIFQTIKSDLRKFVLELLQDSSNAAQILKGSSANTNSNTKSEANKVDENTTANLTRIARAAAAAEVKAMARRLADAEEEIDTLKDFVKTLKYKIISLENKKLDSNHNFIKNNLSGDAAIVNPPTNTPLAVDQSNAASSVDITSNNVDQMDVLSDAKKKIGTVTKKDGPAASAHKSNSVKNATINSNGFDQMSVLSNIMAKIQTIDEKDIPPPPSSDESDDDEYAGDEENKNNEASIHNTMRHPNLSLLPAVHWNWENVKAWLEITVRASKDTIAIFEKLDVIGVLLLEIEEEDLIKDPDMKIDNLAERKKLWKAIYSLKKAEDTL